MEVQEQYVEQESTYEQEVARIQAGKLYEDTIGGAQVGFAEVMLEEKSIPQEIVDLFPVFADKEFALTNIRDDNDLWLMKLLFEDAINDYRIYNPHYHQLPQIEQKISLLRAKWIAKLYRSLGGRDRERALYHTMISSQEKPQQTQRSGGILSRLMSRFRP